MKNIRYQQDAVSELVEKTLSLLSYQGNRHILVFKSPTGSGKTVMAAEMLRYLNNELSENPNAPCSEVAYMDCTQPIARTELLQDEERLLGNQGTTARHL